MRIVSRGTRVRVAGFVAAAAALLLPASAFAHAELSPPVAKTGQGQFFTLAVPTEEADATTTGVELNVPDGFAIDGFAPAPGWRRTVEKAAEGDDATFRRVTWTGGSVPTGEDAVFQFLATPASAKTYTFAVRQTYSNGKIVEWSGAESSDTPAPTVEVKDSLGGGSSRLAIVAVVLGGLGVVLGLFALLAGRRPLT